MFRFFDKGKFVDKKINVQVHAGSIIDEIQEFQETYLMIFGGGFDSGIKTWYNREHATQGVYMEIGVWLHK